MISKNVFNMPMKAWTIFIDFHRKNVIRTKFISKLKHLFSVWSHIYTVYSHESLISFLYKCTSNPNRWFALFHYHFVFSFKGGNIVCSSCWLCVLLYVVRGVNFVRVYFFLTWCNGFEVVNFWRIFQLNSISYKRPPCEVRLTLPNRQTRHL